MTNESNSPKWWQTITGVLTASTAIITAITGLMVALHQTGWLTKTPSPVAPESSVSRPVESKGESAPSKPSVVDYQASNSSGLKPGVRLESPQVVRLGNFIYTLERADLVEYNAENLALRIKLRMQNNEKFPANFWNQSFRLLVDSIPKSPSGDLNVLVEGGSAVDGELEFVVPKQSSLLSLRILDGDDKTEVKL